MVSIEKSHKLKIMFSFLYLWFLEGDLNDPRIDLDNYHYICTKNNVWFFIFMNNQTVKKKANHEKYFNSTYDEPQLMMICLEISRN